MTKLKYWCQKVLPSVYDDSLSYYELLGKVVDAINEIIDDVDALNEFRTNINSIIEDEIDTMIENGEFEEILTGLFNIIICEEYDPTETYIKFMMCFHDGKLYWCNTNTYTTGDWDSSVWVETTIGYELHIINNKLFSTLHAGDVRYTNGGTYNDNTVGAALNTLNGRKTLYYTNVAFSQGSDEEIARIPASGTDDNITTNTVVANIEFANNYRIRSNVSWHSYAGYITFSGTCSAATSANILLVDKVN